ncbi:histidinol phosphatase [Mycetocola tolaasinivorans]|uniref:Histidinol phosphatase n=2 Tax=Mycetocola tolaasinivorans TaxID=76635 RepID=A0A3L7A8T7_9MICO|nr:histidinol phosphatase [Mycetocola tolaasinivorans]
MLNETSVGVRADDLVFALELAALADAESLPRYAAANLKHGVKADGSVVTEADTATERVLRAAIEHGRPEDGFFGEETGEHAGRSTRRWIIDPIDGTANFLRGVPNWGTLIALEIDGVPVLGVVSAPALGLRWWAQTGHGAWRQQGTREPTRLRVSAVDRVDQASLSFQSVESWSDAGHLDALLELCADVWRDRAYGDLWAYMLLAEGALDAVCEFNVFAYDLAAVIPIVREAGGTCTDVNGRSSHTSGNLLATNGPLHEQIRARITG